jgi:hypothetical protein
MNMRGIRSETKPRAAPEAAVNPLQSVSAAASEQAHGRVEGDEGESREPSELGIAEPELGHDEVREARQQLPVHEVHHVEQSEEQQEAVVSRRQSGIAGCVGMQGWDSWWRTIGCEASRPTPEARSLVPATGSGVAELAIAFADPSLWGPTGDES